MSLFTQLRRLYAKGKFRLEDFHTEIVAQVLRNSRQLVSEWLCAFDWQGRLDLALMHEPDSITVATQEQFAALDDHATDSRPDIAIRLCKDDWKLLVLVESKIGSKEGFDQLTRYAEHLGRKPHTHSTALIYITRDFETEKTLPKLPKDVAFAQTRWFEFCRSLQRCGSNDALERELIRFMEENNMSQRNQFTTIDVLALTNFTSARTLMDATMWGTVSIAFAQKLAKVSTPKRAMNQLYEHQRYVIYSAFGAKCDLEILLGYWFDDDRPGNFPWVGVMIYVNPKSRVRERIVRAMRSFLATKTGTWSDEDLTDEREWGSIWRGSDLRDFLAKPDHIEAIKAFFIELLGEVADFRARNKGLPWSPGAPEREEE